VAWESGQAHLAPDAPLVSRRTPGVVSQTPVQEGLSGDHPLDNVYILLHLAYTRGVVMYIYLQDITIKRCGGALPPSFRE
jgi:hypothetical protein